MRPPPRRVHRCQTLKKSPAIAFDKQQAAEILAESSL